MERGNEMSRMAKRIIYAIIAILIIAAIGLNFYKLPYFVEKPGAAESIDKIIHVKNGQKVDGQFMLVYIYEGQANLYQYLWAKYDQNEYTKLIKAQLIKYPDESQKEYSLRQGNYMTEAQQTASYVAYKAAGKNPVLKKEGVLVLNVVSTMPASKVLKPGDIIVGFEGHEVHAIQDLQPLVKDLKKNQTVHMKVKRNGEIKEVQVKVGQFPDSFTKGKTKYGIGIIQSNKIVVKTEPKVSFDINNIGGPSAGLMMTLEIYDQLSKKNLAKGYHVAGTGTMSFDGKVGPIGGIKEKVVGADQSGVDIFFAPTAEHQAKDAMAAAKDIGTDMKIVPVSTFNDALKYLKNMSPK